MDETLRLLKAFKAGPTLRCCAWVVALNGQPLSHPTSQFTDTHGEVCPAGWKPGAKSMKADPKGSLEYFSAVNK